jgi:hypothetical protein
LGTTGAIQDVVWGRLVQSSAPASAWALLSALYALAAHRGAAAVTVDGQAFELAALNDETTQARAIGALDRCGALVFERPTAGCVIAHTTELPR